MKLQGNAGAPAEHTAPEELVLAGEFPAATRKQSRELVAGVLAELGADDVLVVVGGDTPPDVPALLEAGAPAVHRPRSGTGTVEAEQELLRTPSDRLGR